MNVAFYCTAKPICQAFANVFGRGVRAHGDAFDVRPIDDAIGNDSSVACILGVQHRATFAQLQKSPTRIVYLDKGYTRSWDYRRVAIDDCQPTAYLNTWHKPADRCKRFGWFIKPWRIGGNIILAWSSAGYHLFKGLAPPDEYALHTMVELRKHTKRQIIYRPKPNSRERLALEGMWTSQATQLQADLINAHALITFGSSACLDAMMAGVPSIVLGDAVMRPISSTSLDEIEYPRYAGHDERVQILNNLAYCQWHVDEYESGEAWSDIRQQLLAKRLGVGDAYSMANRVT